MTERKVLKVGALFAGYGGIEMALAQVAEDYPDVEIVLAWYAEVDPAASKILAHHYPGVPNLGDVTKVDWTTVEPVDVITGGSPCQDLSHAGKRAGMKAGTRSGLWASMCDAIDIIRPRLVVWENVRGALSAEADSAVEPCPLCVGDRPGPTLRALGRVLGDLAELGYDARWYGLRAADVGAPHGRFRVFLFATPADADGGRGFEAFEHDGRSSARGHGAGVPHQSDRDALWARPDGGRLIPTPTANDYKGSTVTRQQAGAHRGQLDAFVEGVTLLPTPVADNSRGLPQTGTDFQSLPNVAVSLLPTPSAEPTRDQSYCDVGNCQACSGYTEDELDPETCMCACHDPEDIPQQHLLPTPQAHDAQGPKSPEQVATMRAKGHGVRNLNEEAAHCQDWREYAPAIRRWEALTRAAPPPTEPGAKGQPRLSPAFVEWMMGLPLGHVTDPAIGISRNEQLKALGNGVVPQQCAAATRAFIHDTQKAAAC